MEYAYIALNKSNTKKDKAIQNKAKERQTKQMVAKQNKTKLIKAK